MNQLFAFFNSGKHSGASQPHRHIQFLPVEEMVDDANPGKGWRLLLEDPSLHLGALHGWPGGSNSFYRANKMN